MGINELAIERIFRLLIEEKAVVKLLKIMENEKIGEGETIFSTSNKKILMWPQSVIKHTMPWLN
jgi:hypothetical protein